MTKPIPIRVWREERFTGPPQPVDAPLADLLEVEIVLCREYTYECPLCLLRWTQTVRGDNPIPDPIHPDRRVWFWPRHRGTCDGGIERS